jgi:5'-3' exonuclease
MRYAVVDLDSLGFIVAYMQFSQLGNKGDSEKVKKHVKDFVSSILTNVEAEEYVLVAQAKSHDNFRKKLYSSYKEGRKELPEFFIHWKDTIYEAYDEMAVVYLYSIESDDFLSIISKELHKTNKHHNELILCHNDKDMHQLWGNHYMLAKGTFISLDKQEAKRKYQIQLIMGDSTDSIKGCVGIGPKKAEKFLESKTKISDIYKSIYAENWKEEYTKTFKLVTLLSPNQKYEKLNFSWQKNSGLNTLESLFGFSEEVLQE